MVQGIQGQSPATSPAFSASFLPNIGINTLESMVKKTHPRLSPDSGRWWSPHRGSKGKRERSPSVSPPSSSLRSSRVLSHWLRFLKTPKTPEGNEMAIATPDKTPTKRTLEFSSPSSTPGTASERKNFLNFSRGDPPTPYKGKNKDQ